MTVSSARIRIFRSCDKIASHKWDNSATASSSSRQIGAPDVFPLVITSRSGISIPSSYWKISSCTGAYGSITPTFGFSGATEGASRVSDIFSDCGWLSFLYSFDRLSNSKIGFWWPVRIASCSGVTMHSRFTTVSSFAMIAKGFAGRHFNVRRRLTASSFVASQHKWKPPIPLIATIPPSWIICRV